MSNIMIIKEEHSENRTDWRLLVGKREVHIGYNQHTGCLNVLCLNASHRAYRMAGRSFYGHGAAFEEALQAYKSADVKSAIRFVIQETLS